MKTPDETKKGLECCKLHDGYDDADCSQCPYTRTTGKCVFVMHDDALAYIQQLEKELKLERAAKKGTIVLTSSGDFTWEIERMPGWISVEERLPEAKLSVLAFGQRYSSYNKKGEPFPMTHVAYTRGEGEGWFTYSNDDYVEVTHWMPLPEPPEV